MKRKLLFFSLIICALFTNAQTTGRESKAPKLDPFLPVLQYPLFKGSKWMGVIPVKNVNDKPEANKVYKLLFDFTENGTKADMVDKPNQGIEEIARVLNLHVASGINPKNLKVTVLVHSLALMSVLNNEVYQKKFNVSNPNADLIDQMQKAGVHFVVCGQSINMRGIADIELYKSVFVAESAMVALTKYQTAGYVVFDISDNN